MKRITYRYMHEVNCGTENEPELHQVFNTVTIECGEDTFESNYAAAQRHSCDGEIAVEDIPDEENEPTVEERLDELEDALCELDASNAEAIAAIEDALCELDM